MTEINDKWLDDYFNERPQLTPPPKGRFGYKIPKQWFHPVHSLLLQIAKLSDEADAPYCAHCHDIKRPPAEINYCSWCGKNLRTANT